MDTKRIGRFTRPGHRVTGIRDRSGTDKRARVGWEFCRSIIDDHSRLAYSELHAEALSPRRDETITSTIMGKETQLTR